MVGRVFHTLDILGTGIIDLSILILWSDCLSIYYACF